MLFDYCSENENKIFYNIVNHQAFSQLDSEHQRMLNSELHGILESQIKQEEKQNQVSELAAKVCTIVLLEGKQSLNCVGQCLSTQKDERLHLCRQTRTAHIQATSLIFYQDILIKRLRLFENNNDCIASQWVFHKNSNGMLLESIRHIPCQLIWFWQQFSLLWQVDRNRQNS